MPEGQSKPLQTSKPRILGLLLAAGRGSRFDPSGKISKLLQHIDGSAIVTLAATQLHSACENVIAVIRPEQPGLRLTLEQAACLVTECADAHAGMGHSLAWGIVALLRLPD